jgi:hypothetical protein
VHYNLSLFEEDRVYYFVLLFFEKGMNGLSKNKMINMDEKNQTDMCAVIQCFFLVEGC